MARLTPLDRDDLPDLAPLFSLIEQGMGFLPNSLLVMGRWPELVRAFGALAATVIAPRKVDPTTKQLVAFVASRAAGCTYCQAHTAHGAARGGVSVEKLAAAFEFETSEQFSEPERAAMRLARDASITPAEVSDAHFEALREHYDEDSMLEIVAVIALFGWMNRWNSTLATPLEDGPLRFGLEHLAVRGWEPGKHASRGKS